ncbi:MAG: UDP-N-acetylmuramate--L-alanine ligase [Candidatus Nomurabacteria bacterium]|nr:MAG: UDP-N-acetylmuramate--L-alanine ligase [Candidatus Nomurabacteria bacterium]
MKLLKAKHVHCIGIGGIGISALARWLRSEGISVSGSDAADSDNIRQLRDEKIEVRIGESHLPEASEVVLYSPAIAVTHPERQEAARKNIPVLSYPEALAQMSEGLQVIAVSGTHGKTSTTTFLGMLLEAAQLDPIVVVGSRVKNWGGNFRAGKGKYLVLEADEFNRSFLNYHPEISVVTNIEHDHVDTYAHFEDVLDTFTQFLGQTKGTYFLNADDPGIQQLPQHIRDRAHWFSLNNAKQDLQISHDINGSTLVSSEFGTIHVPLPGEHMISNALGAIAVAQHLGVKKEAIELGFSRLQGIERRFQHLGTYFGTEFISDYAHHPTEIAATLQAAKQIFPDKKLIVVFQPHQQQRLNAFGSAFTEALVPADTILLYHTYEVLGREQNKANVFTLEDLYAQLQEKKKNVELCDTEEVLDKSLHTHISSNAVVLCLGAGSVHALMQKILAKEQHDNAR